MWVLRRVAVLGLLLILVVACGKDKPTGPKPTEITGTWIATKIEYHSKSSSDVVDLITAGGSGTFVVNETRTYVLTLTPAGGTTHVNAGTWSLGGDTFTLSELGMPFSVVYDVTLSGNLLELGGGDVEYDFDNNGAPEQADLNLAFTR